ncbi:hypothetical protein KIN20_023719 [Parelaphostrongylus tenuis]|uniref:Uncharacterized protein n=1 Tax=Parelaphostrongylus tenuis TaxID=148309 RepID=A0AAD5NAC6_PARTN|nr:hypothetical protein KIN20_023719 [Parelaphostrongylus tenuis]
MVYFDFETAFLLRCVTKNEIKFLIQIFLLNRAFPLNFQPIFDSLNFVNSIVYLVSRKNFLVRCGSQKNVKLHSAQHSHQNTLLCRYEDREFETWPLGHCTFSGVEFTKPNLRLIVPAHYEVLFKRPNLSLKSTRFHLSNDY